MTVKVTYLKSLLIDDVELPARTASLNRSGNTIDNSNFLTSGDGFTSRMTGLKDWNVDAEGDLSTVQGYKAVLKKSGTPTGMTGAACTLVSAKTYQITDATKRVLDPGGTFVVYDNAVDHTSDVESIDYLFGKVTFKSTYTVTGAVTITGDYLPMAVIAQNHGSLSLEMSGTDLDATTRADAQSNGGWMVHQVGLIDITASVERFDDLANTYHDLLIAQTPVLLEFSLANGALICRGWFVLTADNAEGDVSGLENETMEFALYGKTTTNFGYAATASLNSAISKLLTAFFARTTVTGKYLPDGTNGQSGKAYVLSFSIEADDDREQFSLNLVSAGALADVP